MSGARKTTNQDSMISILTKLESMLNMTRESYDDSLVILRSSEAILKNEVSVELKTQTKILSSISSKIDRLSGSGMSQVKDSGLGSAIGGIPAALKELVKILALGAVFGPFIELGAKSIANSMRIILEASKGIDPVVASTTLAFFGLITASKIGDFVKVLSGSIGLKDLLGFGIGMKAKQIASAMRSMLSILEPQPGGLFGMGADPRKISMQSAMASIFAINLLSASNIGKLYEVLFKPLGLMDSIFGGSSPSKIAKRLTNSIRELLLIATYSKENQEDGLGAAGTAIPLDIVAKSVLAIGLLSASNIKDLIDALKPAFGGIFGSGAKGMEKRAKGIASSVRHFLTISEGIDDGVMIRSVFAIGIISISISNLISTLKSAAIWNPFIIIGLKITSKAISSLLESTKSLTASGEQLVGAGLYLVALSFSIGTLLTMTVVAALVAPLVIIGSFALKFMISSFVSIKSTMDASKMDGEFIKKVSKLTVVAGAIIGIASLIINFTSTNDMGTAIKNVIMLSVLSYGIVLMTTKLAGLLSGKESKIKTLDILGLAVSNLVNAIGLMIASKAMENAPDSIKKALMFGLMQAILVGSTMFVVKMMSSKDVKASSLLAYNLFVLGMVATTMLVILFINAVGAAGIGSILLFSLMVIAIGMTAVLVSKIVEKYQKQIMKTVITLGLWVIALAAIGLVSTIFANPQVLLGAFILSVSVVLLAFAFRFVGKSLFPILKGTLAVLAMSLVIMLLTPPLIEFKKSKFGILDGLTLAGTIAILGVVFGIAGAGPIPIAIALGALVIGLVALALIAMTYALSEFQKLKWTKENSDNLSYTIKSVLGALSGTSGDKGVLENVGSAVGQGLQAILSLISIGPIILGSAAIWLMSVALEKFQSIGWDKNQSDILGGTITTVLNSLSGKSSSGIGKDYSPGGSMLDTIVSLMSGGTLIIGAASIWLLSEALLKFKEVNWTASDTKQLSFTMNEILGVMQGAEEDGGLWSKIKGAAGSLVGAVGSAGNATSLGLASLSILSMSNALAKWKTIGWDNTQTDNLTNALNKILISFKLTKNDDGLVKTAQNFDKIQNSLKLMKDHINSLDLEKLTTTDSLFKSLAILSKNPEAMADKIGDTLKLAFEEFGKALTQAIKEAGGGGSVPVDEGAPRNQIAALTANPATNKPEKVQPQPIPMITPEMIKQAMQTALNSATLTVKPAPNTSWS
jgi:hypothetical protein